MGQKIIERRKRTLSYSSLEPTLDPELGGIRALEKIEAVLTNKQEKKGHFGASSANKKHTSISFV